MNGIKNVELYISNVLVESLKNYGSIKWHKNSNHSFYIKFRDVRLGSIRIANHRGRDRYHYTYEIFKSDKDIERKIDDIVNAVIDKSQRIYNFDPEKYIVFDIKERKYKEVNGFREYKEAILNKRQ